MCSHNNYWWVHVFEPTLPLAAGGKELIFNYWGSECRPTSWLGMGKLKQNDKIRSLTWADVIKPVASSPELQKLKGFLMNINNLFTPGNSHSNTDWPLTGRSGPRLRWKMLPACPVFQWHNSDLRDSHTQKQVWGEQIFKRQEVW